MQKKRRARFTNASRLLGRSYHRDRKCMRISPFTKLLVLFLFWSNHGNLVCPSLHTQQPTKLAGFQSVHSKHTLVKNGQLGERREFACTFCHGFVAQWLECLSTNQKDPGLKPPAGLCWIFFCFLFFCLIRPSVLLSLWVKSEKIWLGIIPTRASFEQFNINTKNSLKRMGGLSWSKCRHFFKKAPAGVGKKKKKKSFTLYRLASQKSAAAAKR